MSLATLFRICKPVSGEENASVSCTETPKSSEIFDFSPHQSYVGCSGSSWNLVIKCSNIYIILSCFEISQVDINELASRSL